MSQRRVTTRRSRGEASNDALPATAVPERKRRLPVETAAGERDEHPAKRTRASSPKQEKAAIRWTHNQLYLVQPMVGTPCNQALFSYCHPCTLQLPLQPGVQTWDNIVRHFQRSPWNASYPVPLVTQQSCNLRFYQHGEWVDPMVRLIKAKRAHTAALNGLRVQYRRNRATYAKTCKKEVGLFPQLVYKLAEKMERDPDGWFCEDLGYDYYFTGGSLGVDERFQVIVNTVGETARAVEITPYEIEANLLRVSEDQKKRYELDEEGGPVLEVVMAGETYLDDGELVIALRRKHEVVVLSSKTGHLEMQRYEVRSEKVPLISCCLLICEKGRKLFSTDLERNLKAWNYRSNRVDQTLKLEKSSETDDGWSCIRLLNSKYSVCVDRSSLRIFQLKNWKMHMVLETKLSSWLWRCEKASSLEVCTESNLILIGTAHKLMVLQLITTDLEVELQHHISFTHNLHHYPTMIRCQVSSSATYHVWLSSHLPGDTMLCTFSKTPPKRFTTNYIPKKPYNLQESTQLARTNGKCIYPASALKQRLQLCHSGLAMITDGDDSQRFHMLLQNSCGDIFHQTLSTDSHDYDNFQQIPVLLHSWMNQLNSFVPSCSSTPQATDFKNMRGFRRIFTASELPVSDTAPTPSRRPPRWRRSVEQLHQYKDMLAADMLAAWGFRPDVSSNKDKAAAVKEKQLLGEGSRIDMTERITSWLDDTVECDADDGAGDADEVIVGDVLCKEEAMLEDRPVEEVQVVVTATPAEKRLKNSEEMLGGTPRPTPKGARKRYVQGF